MIMHQPTEPLDQDELKRPPANTTSSTVPDNERPDTCCPLAFLPAPKPVEDRSRPRQRRAISAIDPLVRSVIAELASGFRPWPLVMLGSTGGGKTCSSLVMADHVKGAKYFTAAEFYESLTDAEFGRLQNQSGYSTSTRKFWSDWVSAPLAILDEVGLRGKVSDAAYAATFHAIDRRHAQPLVVISNLSIHELHQVFDDRVVSRLAAGTVLRFSGDRRVGEPCRVTIAERATKL